MDIQLVKSAKTLAEDHPLRNIEKWVGVIFSA